MKPQHPGLDYLISLARQKGRLSDKDFNTARNLRKEQEAARQAKNNPPMIEELPKQNPTSTEEAYFAHHNPTFLKSKL